MIFPVSRGNVHAMVQINRYNMIIMEYIPMFRHGNICYDPLLEPFRENGSNEESHHHIWGPVMMAMEYHLTTWTKLKMLSSPLWAAKSILKQTLVPND